MCVFCVFIRISEAFISINQWALRKNVQKSYNNNRYFIHYIFLKHYTDEKEEIQIKDERDKVHIQNLNGSCTLFNY